MNGMVRSWNVDKGPDMTGRSKSKAIIWRYALHLVVHLLLYKYILHCSFVFDDSISSHRLRNKLGAREEYFDSVAE